MITEVVAITPAQPEWLISLKQALATAEVAPNP